MGLNPIYRCLYIAFSLRNQPSLFPESRSLYSTTSQKLDPCMRTYSTHVYIYTGLDPIYIYTVFNLRLPPALGRTQFLEARTVDGVTTNNYGCILMLRYWSSRWYSTLRTLVLLAAGFRRQPTPAHPFPVSSVVLVWPVHARGFCHSPRRFLACFYKSMHLGNTPPRSTV